MRFTRPRVAAWGTILAALSPWAHPNRGTPPLRIAIVAHYLTSRPWDPTPPWTRAIATGLADRGHEISILCDGWTSSAVGVLDGLPVHPRREVRRLTVDEPRRFQQWLHERLDHLAPEGVVSLTHLMPSEVWVPLDRSFSETLAWIWGHRLPASIAMQTLTRRFLPGLLMAMRHAAREARAGRTHPLALTARGAPGIPVAALVPPMSAAHRDMLRARARTLLGIADDELVLCASARQRGATVFSGLLQALARVDRPCTLLVIDGAPHSVATLAHRHGVEPRVVPLSVTQRIDAVLAASDAVFAADDHGNPLGAGLVGPRRLGPEGLRMGRPLLCTQGSLTEALLDLDHGEGGGIAIRGPGADGWIEALQRLADPHERARLSDRATRLGHALTLDRTLDAIESRLRSPNDVALYRQSAEIDLGPSLPATRSM